jgi:hypothetical protein
VRDQCDGRDPSQQWERITMGAELNCRDMKALIKEVRTMAAGRAQRIDEIEDAVNELCKRVNRPGAEGGYSPEEAEEHGLRLNGASPSTRFSVFGHITVLMLEALQPFLPAVCIFWTNPCLEN